jgi:hypothetical protein
MLLKRIETDPSMEDWFEYWLIELKEAGFVKRYSRTLIPWVLEEKVMVSETYTKVLYKGTKRERTEQRTKKMVLLNGSSYKADFIIEWTEKAHGLFYCLKLMSRAKDITPFHADVLKASNGEVGIVSYVDVKSPFKGKNCSDATFSVNRKAVYNKYNIFVNKAILMPNKKIKKPGEYIFPRTFTPTRYRFTNKTLVKKSIKNWAVRDLEDFIYHKRLENGRNT